MVTETGHAEVDVPAVARVRPRLHVRPLRRREARSAIRFLELRVEVTFPDIDYGDENSREVRRRAHVRRAAPVERRRRVALCQHLVRPALGDRSADARRREGVGGGGDGLAQPTSNAEACDDGQNGDDDDGCTDACQLPACGDGIAQPNSNAEACDDGQNGDDDDGCTDACAQPTCGDGIVQPASNDEICDDGNTEDDDACSGLCAPPTCGDGLVQPTANDEECDDGAGNGDDQACLSSCQLNVCGDGFQSPTEGCDDGNTFPGDGCSPACQSEACGNGLVDAGEACGDGQRVCVASRRE